MLGAVKKALKAHLPPAHTYPLPTPHHHRRTRLAAHAALPAAHPRQQHPAPTRPGCLLCHLRVLCSLLEGCTSHGWLGGAEVTSLARTHAASDSDRRAAPPLFAAVGVCCARNDVGGCLTLVGDGGPMVLRPVVPGPAAATTRPGGQAARMRCTLHNAANLPSSTACVIKPCKDLVDDALQLFTAGQLNAFGSW